MPTIQTLIAAFIEDVNREDGRFLHYCESTTNFLFFLIKWGGIPFIFYILYEFTRL
ncbi:hypothetical protein RCG17_03630 [Neobacillus sp. PS3-12]|uniref:hypothetical protein n=1 Tax=Neobacillus sp. PS3-12 TaxID=3070677 RepID=UPI0027E1CCAD|nr:hypothetical protein [Neobacillus sp. PS3-12]WML53776.1 hypothetical protein RCG17_03630 [Neobacillus sp. PS3-12]